MIQPDKHLDNSARSTNADSSERSPPRGSSAIVAFSLALLAALSLVGGWLYLSSRESHADLFQKGLTAAAADPTLGEQYLRAAIQRAEDGVYPDAEIVLGRLLIQRGDHQGALRSFDHIDLEACRSDLALAFARAAFQADLTTLAEQTLNVLASREVPEREAALEMLRDHYLEWGQDEKCLAVAQRLTRLSPANPRHWTTLVELQARMSRHSECAQSAQDAIAADLPSEVKQELRNTWIEALINLGDIERIERELAELQRVEGDSLRVRGHQVYLHRLKGESSQALELINRIIDGGADGRFHSSPPETQAHAHFTRGIVLFDLRRFDEAARDLERVLELQPANSANKFKLSEAYRALGRAEDSLRQREEATAIVDRRKKIAELLRRRETTPQDPTIYRELAALHQQAGDSAGAARWQAWASRVAKIPQ